MKKIKFRGISAESLNDGEWVYGYLYRDSDGLCWILREGGVEVEWNMVYSNTIGQFTGLEDNNQKEIYEGDIVRWRSHPKKTVEASEVRWSSLLKWVLVWFADDFEREKNYPSTKDLGGHINSIKIIGNIHDNPELLSQSND